jgi:hypothetical protein
LLSRDELILVLQRAGRLDEYLEKLLPIVLEDREMSQQASDALTQLYLHQAFTEQEGTTP